MKHFIYLNCFLFLLDFSTLSQINLKGIVINDGCNTSINHKDCEVFKNIRISVGTLNSITDVNGRFAIDLPVKYTPGAEVITNVQVPGYSIHMPLYGRFNLPNTQLDNVFEQRIIMLPRGSLKHLTNATIVAFIHDIAKRESAKAKSEKEKVLKDFGLYFKEFADYHGFTPTQVKELIDQWANSNSVKDAVNDFMLQGARNYYLKNFEESSLYYEKAGKLMEKPLEERIIYDDKRIKETVAEIDSVCNAYLLAGSSAMEAYDFKRAIRLYNKADRIVSLPDSLQKRYGFFQQRKWQIRDKLAVAFWKEGARTNGAEGIVLLAEAVTLHREALNVYTKEHFPQDWAKAQNNLANALYDQGIRIRGDEGTTLLAQAVAAYHAALEIRTKENFPQEWATTQSNLGAVLLDQASRTDGRRGTALLDQALAAHLAALKVFTKGDFPQDWAITYHNMGNVYLQLGCQATNQDGAILLIVAVTAYHNALDIITKKNLPQGWAMTQHNLGEALKEQAIRTEGQEATALLEQAVTAYHSSLGVFTKKDLPQYWAMTQNSLGSALREQGIRIGGQKGITLLARAVAAGSSALEIYTKKDLPQDWAATQNKLGYTLTEQGMRTDGPEGVDLLEQAVTACRAALEIYTKKDLPQDWANTQNNLGFALKILGFRIGGQKGAALLTQAVAAYYAALEIYSESDLPQHWARVQNNLGLLYEQTKQWKLAIQHFENMHNMYPEYAKKKINEIRVKMKE